MPRISLAKTHDSYKFPEMSKIIIKRNILGSKWILKVNEKKKATGDKYGRRIILYTCVTSIIFVSCCAGLIALFYGTSRSLQLYQFELRTQDPLLSIPKRRPVPIVPANSGVASAGNSSRIHLAKYRTETSQNATSASEKDTVSNCGRCRDGEICIFLPDESDAKCRKIHDSADPTGCGGLCQLETQYCRKITPNADVFQCIEYPQLIINCRLDGSSRFRCGDLCIPETKKCDGFFHCFDKSDEQECVCNTTTHFHCGGTTSCLPLSYKCNGVVDCWDANDELNCTFPGCIHAEKFSCANGQSCINLNQFCDGKIDCYDGSDEPDGCQ